MRALMCIDCGAGLTYAGTGRPPKRCRPCARKQDRRSSAQRRARDREASKSDLTRWLDELASRLVYPPPPPAPSITFTDDERRAWR